MNRRLKSIITFDAHDPGVEHSVHYTEFDNIFPSNVILKELINNIGFIVITLIGCLLVVEDKMTLGALFTFTSLLVYFLEPIIYRSMWYHKDVKNRILRRQ